MTPSAHTHPRSEITDFWSEAFWANITDKPSTFTPSAHALVGAKHTASGLTVGHVVRASGASAFAWAQLQHSDLGGVTSDLHHTQLHEIEHRSGGGDALNHDFLAGFVAGEHFLQSAITTVGTIGTGAWQGTPIANAYVAGINQNLLTSSSPTFASLTLNVGDLHLTGGNAEVRIDGTGGYLGQFKMTGQSMSLRNYHGENNTDIVLKASDGGIERIVLQYTGATNYTRIYNPRNQSAVALALITRALDAFGACTDITTLNATISKHGLLMKLGGGTVNFLRADGTWAVPTPGAHASSHEVGGGDLIAFADITGFSTWIDQAVKQASTPTFASMTLDTGDLLLSANGKQVQVSGTGGYLAKFYLSAQSMKLSNYHGANDTDFVVTCSDGGISRTVLQYTGATNYTRIYDPRDAAGNALALVSQLHAQIHASSHHSGGGDQVNHDSLLGFVAAEHKSLPNTIAQVLTNHTKAVHDALLITVLGSGALAKDHGTPATDMLVNVCYGTGNPPAANTTTIGTLYIKYTA